MANGLSLQTVDGPKGLQVFEVRPATAEDIANAVLIDYSLKKIKSSHHEIARLLALGLKNVEVAAQTGYTPQHVHNLQNAPAFQELLAHYQKRRTDEVMDLTKSINMTAADALQVLQERLDEAPGAISDKDLLGITEKLLDRAGYSPVKKVLTAGISAADLTALKDARPSPGDDAKTIEVEATEVDNPSDKGSDSIVG